MAHGNLAAKENSAQSPYDTATGAGASYTYPIAKSDTKSPSIDNILSKCKRDEQYWQKRNLRFIRHQDLFDLVEKTPPAGQILATMNDTKVLIEKLAGMVARRSPRIQVPARSESMAPTAQKIENGLRQWEKYIATEWFGGVHNPLDYDRATSLFLRGWVCERMLLDPDSPALVSDILFDPHNIYPRLSGNKIKRVSHIFETTVGDIVDTFPDTDKHWDSEDENTIVTCYSYYENTPPYYHAVVANDTWVKKPTKLGYFPWIIGIAKGAISHHAIGNQLPDQHAEFIGAGFLDTIEGVYKLVNKFVTMLANTLAKQENPPKVINTIDGKPKELDTSAGSTSTFFATEKVQLLEVGPKIGQLLPMLGSLQDRLNKGGLPSAMFGEGTSLESGFMSALLMGAAQDSIWTFVRALAQFHSARYTKFLELFRDYAVDGIDVITHIKGSEDFAGRMVIGDQMTASDVVRNGTYVEVNYEDISPQDRVALGNLAALLVREKLISYQTAREKYLGLDDPELEDDRVLSDILMTNPQFVSRAALLQWKKLGRKPELAALVAEIDKESQKPAGIPNAGGGGQVLPPEMIAALMQAAGGGAPPGPPPEGVPGMGLPPEVAPSGVTPGESAPGPQDIINMMMNRGG